MHSDSYPKVSVITPTFNCERFIAQTIESVLMQSYKNWEMVITDDCSTDDTFSILERYQKEDARIKIHRLEENQGAAVARNFSISQAKGRYLAFLDSDDLWVAEKLDIQIQFMQKSAVAFSFANYEIMDIEGARTGKIVDSGAPREITYSDLLKKTATVGCLTVVIDRDKINDVSMPLIRTGQDYALWLKCLRQILKAERVDSTLGSYRIVPNSISRNKLKKAQRQWEVYRQLESINLFKSIYLMFFYAKNALFRK